jgi:ribosomal protein S27E
MDSIDGNVLAGEFLALDMTSARARCAGCGQIGPVAETVVYDRSAGLVARCSGCSEVLMTLVRAESRTFVSFRGVTFLEFAS